MTTKLPVYISDPTGSRGRSQKDQEFIVKNMHEPIFRKLQEHGLEGVKHENNSIGRDADSSLKNYSGIILLGGYDIDPMFYSRTGNAYKSRSTDTDAFELDLIYAAEMTGKPVLGICRGMQLINVHSGGTMYSDIGSLTWIQHNNFGAQAYGQRATVHGAAVQGSSALPDGAYRVSSSHHQAVRMLGDDLTITGWGEDGIVEMIENEDRGLVGVQWHPESSHIEQDDTLSPLIANLAARAHG